MSDARQKRLKKCHKLRYSCSRIAIKGSCWLLWDLKFSHWCVCIWKQRPVYKIHWLLIFQSKKLESCRYTLQSTVMCIYPRTLAMNSKCCQRVLTLSKSMLRLSTQEKNKLSSMLLIIHLGLRCTHGCLWCSLSFQLQPIERTLSLGLILQLWDSTCIPIQRGGILHLRLAAATQSSTRFKSPSWFLMECKHSLSSSISTHRPIQDPLILSYSSLMLIRRFQSVLLCKLCTLVDIDID